jgi:hypothetical protein
VSIQYSLSGEGDTLRVVASGFDDSREEVEAYGFAIIRTCLELGYRRVLCDESELEYRLSTLDTYRAAVVMAENAPDVARVAIVPNPRFVSDAHFWEDVAANRGLIVRIFRTLADAQRWLAD